jgi:ABC-2 type transport system ATP-binding protein
LGDAVLELASVTKRYGRRTAVNGLSLKVNRGETFGLLGPNGAGKTTTISLICGLLGADEGDVRVGGHFMKREPILGRRVLGFVPQEIALYPILSARENLLFWGKLYGLSGELLRRRVDEALDVVGLADRGRDRVSHYSGGMKRRLNIASGLLHHPQVLLLDEPTVGVDPQSRNHILETVKGLARNGMTVIYTSHYMEEVEYLCTRALIMDEGRGIAQGTMAELRASAGALGRLRAVTNSVAGEAEGNMLSGSLAEIPEVNTVSWNEREWTVLFNPGDGVIARIARCFLGGDIEINDFSVSEPTLEDVFLKLTGKSLRD